MVKSDPPPIVHSETISEIQEDIRDSGLGGEAGRQ
jgi:hypothetical protein